jgi:hypothetical protein
MAIRLPSSPYDFALYTTKHTGPNGLLIGFEYEIQSRNYGAPRDWTPDPVQPNRLIPSPSSKFSKSHPIKYLPPNYQLQYEGLGGRKYGYEIKSPIAPLTIHKRIIKRFLFPNIRTNEKPNGPKNHGAIHVSISRNKFTNPHHLKVFHFLHSDAPEAFLLKLSERHPDTFDLYSPQCYNPDYWQSHYAIINHENSNRFELRLFASRKHLLLPALEMADSLFNLATQVEKVTMEAWTRFVASKLKYADLNALVRKALA